MDDIDYIVAHRYKDKENPARRKEEFRYAAYLAQIKRVFFQVAQANARYARVPCACMRVCMCVCVLSSISYWACMGGCMCASTVFQVCAVLGVLQRRGRVSQTSGERGLLRCMSLSVQL